MRRIATGCICAVLGSLALGGCGDPAPRDLEPANPLVLDWKAGQFNGIALGDRPREVTQKLGQPAKEGGGQRFVPDGEDYYEIGGPEYSRFPFPGGTNILVYDDLAIGLSGGQVYSWVTASSRAETPEGVGVGDTRDVVEAHYPRAVCRTGNKGSEYATFPLCEVKVCTGRRLVFGANPIRSVYLIAERPVGVAECRDPERPSAQGSE